MRFIPALFGLAGLGMLAGVVYYFHFQARFNDVPLMKVLWNLFLLATAEVLGGLVWGGVIGLTVWAINRTSAQHPRHLTLTIFLVTLAVVCITLTRNILLPKPVPAASPTSIPRPVDPLRLDQYSLSERVRIREIISRVMSEADYLTLTIHTEFWNILNRPGAPLPATISGFRNFIADVMTRSQHYFWEDALTSMKTRHPFRSVKRKHLEDELVRLNLIPQSQVQQNEKLIAQIASHQAVYVRGEQVIFTEENIQVALSNIDQAAQRLDRLFMPP